VMLPASAAFLSLPNNSGDAKHSDSFLSPRFPAGPGRPKSRFLQSASHPSARSAPADACARDPGFLRSG
jgi:hypothetical protein